MKFIKNTKITIAAKKEKFDRIVIRKLDDCGIHVESFKNFDQKSSGKTEKNMLRIDK